MGLDCFESGWRLDKWRVRVNLCLTTVSFPAQSEGFRISSPV